MGTPHVITIFHQIVESLRAEASKHLLEMRFIGVEIIAKFDFVADTFLTQASRQHRKMPSIMLLLAALKTRSGKTS
jgi:hypothetical protein